MPSRPAVTPALLAVCDCIKSSHEHGTRGMYGYHRCRCTPCGDANREYNRAASRYKPRRRMAAGDVVRARIEVLRKAEMTMADIAGLCGLKPSVLEYAVYGRHGRPPARVSASTLDALHAISYRDAVAIQPPAGRKLDGSTSRLQVQSLYSAGWCAGSIGPRVGLHASAITNLLRGAGVSERVRSLIDSAYRELHGSTPPEANDRQRAAAARARNRAAANGWSIDMVESLEYDTAA